MFLLEHIFGLWFRLIHGKKIFQQKFKNLFSHEHCDLHIALAGCQLWRDCWEARQWGKSTKDLFSCRKNNRTIFLKSFIWYGGIDKSIRTLLAKESSKMYPSVLGVPRCIKLQNVVHTYFMDVHSLIFQKRIFEIMKFLLVVTEFWTVEP